ncbi:MAG: NUDIX hydrolase [Arenicellales bacterium]|nr:NUDIX hydrolase [Arenicellales bacterium]
MAKPVTPLLATDVIIHLEGESRRSIVLIERKNPPVGWAIPGGFVDIGETVEHAAVREAKEETSLDVTLQDLLGLYSEPTRDPRCHVVSAIYVGTGRGKPAAADDASRVDVFSIDRLPQPMAFDHAQVVKDYIDYLARS